MSLWSRKKSSSAEDETLDVFDIEKRTQYLDGTEETLIDPTPSGQLAIGGIGNYPDDPPPPPPDPGSPGVESIIVFLLALAIYLIPWHGPGWLPTSFSSRDTLGSRLMAASVGGRGSFDVSPWVPGGPSPDLLEHVFIQKTSTSGPATLQTYSPKYPVATGILAAPFFIGVPKTELDHTLTGNAWRSLPIRERLAAAFMAALTVALFHLLVRTVAFGGLSIGGSFLLTVALGLGSPIWSANAQALWSHTGSALAVVVLLHVLARTGVGAAIDPSWRLFLAGLVAGVAIACRPSQAVWLGTIPIALAVTAKRFGYFYLSEFLNRIAAFALGTAVVLGGLVWLHYQLYDSPLSPYMSGLIGLGSGSIEVDGAAGFGEALTGQLLSPGVGLFVFCPIVILAFLGLRTAWYEGVDEIACALTVILLVAMNAMNPYWWGGWSWGPRLFADAMPLLLLLTIPVVRAASRSGLGRLALWAVVGWSVALHAIGVVRHDAGWFAERPDIATDRAPLWNVRHGLIADALRGGLPADPPPTVPEAWQTVSAPLPDWLVEGLGAERYRIAKLDLSAIPEDAESPPMWGFAPTGLFPHRLLGSTTLEGGLIYRDRLQLRIDASALTEAAGKSWLVLVLPADDRHEVMSEALTIDLGEAGEPIPTREMTLEAGGRRWWMAQWPMPPRSAAGDTGLLVTINRPRSPQWGDPLSTIPPLDLVPLPFVLQAAE